MKIFMAAVHSNGYKHSNRYLKLNEFEQSVVNTLPNLLESYHYVNKQSYIDAIRNSGDKVFIDSGAFSAHTLGVSIDLPTYCRYLQQNEDIVLKDDGVLVASVLDGIGDALKTYQNQLEMERHGVRPLPCFHVGEDERYLEWYMANYEYITLGGMVAASGKQVAIWLERIWDKYLTDGSGRPRLKVHGFGLTSVPLMEAFPWYSCDSSSWIQAASFGSVITPDHGPIKVSDKSPSRHVKGQHVENYSDAERSILLAMFEEQGFNFERLSTVYESRAVYNMWSFGRVNDYINRVNNGTFKSAIQELF
jgi:hypothetical protein